MDELITALTARGINFAPVFNGEIHTLPGNAWFLGWEVFTDGILAGREARFGVAQERDYWLDPATNIAAAGVLEARRANSERLNAYLQQMIVMEEGTAAPTLFELPLPKDFSAPEWRADKKGNPQPPSQQQIADALVEGVGGSFTRDSEDPFFWQDTHWQARQPKNFKRYIMNTAQFMLAGSAENRHLSSIHELFMNRAPSLRDNQTFYQQNPFLANFLDGTLEVIKKKDGTYEKVFREHHHEDLLTWVLPYKYKAKRTPNPLFEDWLLRAFQDDPDGAGKVRALQQIGGACLISLFPRIAFLLSNQGGTGKSTFAKLCMKFMGAQNYSNVPPHLMEGFMMESMIGKQANIVTDIGKKAVIPEDFMKLVEDSLPILVNRKGRQAVSARIPALHLFCANALPRGIDGESNAMDRRVTIVEFTKSMLGEGQGAYTRDYEDVLMNAGPGAILDFFEAGLDDLIASNGIYFNPESGKAKLRNWKDSESMTAQFLEALTHGEIGPENAPYAIDPNGKILRSKLTAALDVWAGKSVASLAVNRMFKELGDRGFAAALSNGKRYVKGIVESKAYGAGF